MTVLLYLMGWLGAVGLLWVLKAVGWLPPWTMSLGIHFDAAVAGCLGGIVYCMRGVYLSHSVRQEWDWARWWPWYVLRPPVSAIVGGVSPLVVRAGLLALEARQDPNSGIVAYLVVAFVAGHSVESFLQRVQEAGEAAFGVRRSRAAKAEEKT